MTDRNYILSSQKFKAVKLELLGEGNFSCPICGQYKLKEHYNATLPTEELDKHIYWKCFNCFARFRSEKINNREISATDLEVKNGESNK